MDSHVETELLAYLDGELNVQQQAQVEAHLAQCADCAAELERLRTLQQGLGATFDAALTPVRLPPAADARIREHLQKRLRARTGPRLWLMFWRRRGLIAQALLAVLVLFFTLNVTQALRAPPPALPQETLVLGQNKLSPGSEAALRVIVRSAEEAEPIADADVVVRVGRAPGLASIVYTGRTDANGTANVTFTVPESLEGQASLVVETSSDGIQDQIVHPITIARDYKLFLSSDKPAYRPGQTIHLRALALDAVGLKPVEGQKVTFTLLTPDSQLLERGEANSSEFGIAALDFDLPADAAHGQYTLRAALGDAVSGRAVTVGDYELPAFRVTVETDRDFYAPGARVTGSVLAEYFFGRPVADAQVTLRGYTQEPSGALTPPDVIVQGRTDAEGRLAFAFSLPGWFGQSATQQPVPLDLEAEVIDGAGQRSGIRNLLPVAAQPILISAIPESGRLKPGFENVIFVMTVYPDGQPTETTLTIAVEGKEHTLVTSPYGLAEFRYVPRSATTFEISAQDAQGAKGYATFAFQTDQVSPAFLLRTERVAYEVGDTLRVEALVGVESIPARSDQTVYLDVVRAGQTIAVLSTPLEDIRAVFALDLDEAMVGTLELHAYYVRPDGSLMQDTRLVIVDAPRQVAVAVSADRAAYRPGETAHVEIQTTLTSTDQRTNRPIQAALGIGVVDESVYALETLPPGFVRAYFLLEQELLERRGRGLDVPTLLESEAEEEIRAAQEAAAKAAWAGAQGTGFSLSAKSTVEPGQDLTTRLILSNRLGLLLAAIPLLLSAIVAQGLGITGVLGRALRRVGIGILMFFIASPLIALLAGGVMWLLWMALGVGAPVAILLIVVALLAALAVHGWARRDARLQLATGLLAAYLVLGGLLIVLAARGGDLGGPLLALVVVTFILAVIALATLGQGLVLEGWRRPGWAATLLAMLLVPLVIYLSLVPGLASNLTSTLGNPVLYAGPVGWLTGCAPAATMTPESVKETMIVKEEGEAVEQTVEMEVTAVPAEPTEAPGATEAPTAAPTEAPLPTSTSQPEPPPTPEPTPTAPAPIEPFPLRQVFPETLYWNAEALTDENGRFALDLPLADTITTWRLTALASTQDGELGVATYDLLVFQDFIAELGLPQTVAQGQTVTATVALYNFLPQAQTVRVEIAPAGWYDLVSAPQQTITLPPDGIATAAFVIRAAQAGDFSLQVTAVGETMSDAVARYITVEP